MMSGRKSGSTDGDDSDRKHLTGREVQRLIEATKGSRNEARDHCEEKIRIGILSTITGHFERLLGFATQSDNVFADF